MRKRKKMEYDVVVTLDVLGTIASLLLRDQNPRILIVVADDREAKEGKIEMLCGQNFPPNLRVVLCFAHPGGGKKGLAEKVGKLKKSFAERFPDNELVGFVVVPGRVADEMKINYALYGAGRAVDEMKIYHTLCGD